MSWREYPTLGLFSLAVAAGLALEAGGAGGHAPWYAAVALLFAASLLAPIFPVAALAFVGLTATKHLLWQPHGAAMHDLLPVLLAAAYAPVWLVIRLRGARFSDETYRDLFFLVAGALYFEAGCYKLANFADWRSGQLLCDLFRYHGLFRGALALPLAPCGAVPVALAWGTLLFEVAFVAAAWARRLRVPFLFAAIAFHAGVYLTLDVNFLLYQLGILGAVLVPELLALRAARECPFPA